MGFGGFYTDLLFAEGAFLHSNREPLRKLREISSLFQCTDMRKESLQRLVSSKHQNTEKRFCTNTSLFSKTECLVA